MSERLRKALYYLCLAISAPLWISVGLAEGYSIKEMCRALKWENQ